MRAARQFAQVLGERARTRESAPGATLTNCGVDRIVIDLHGSLGATGRGHATDRAVVLGLMGVTPEGVDPDTIGTRIGEIEQQHRLAIMGHASIEFNPSRDIRYHLTALPYHANALTLSAYAGDATCLTRTYYSVGGGFILDEDEAARGAGTVSRPAAPYPFQSAAGLLALCETQGLRIADLMRANERAWASDREIDRGILDIWQAMQACVRRGLAQEGELPGGLRVRRRAARLYRTLHEPRVDASAGSLDGLDWINLYALAVNEENAAGGRVVTAPTNGAAGIIPAVLHYHMQFNPRARPGDVPRFLLAAAAIGILCKTNASLSGAEVGCQGEVGSACAMAAAGLAEVLGGSPAQVENAAEIGLEHNLGLTCDPVGGLVQVPCIERNAMAAVKAVNAARMALNSDGQHVVSLDQVIQTMRDTGRDMSHKYKETSLGGLAVSVVAC